MKKNDLLLLQKMFTAMAMPVTSTIENWDAVCCTIYYRNNPDGSLRWAWPKGMGKPVFLKFYSTSSSRANWIARIIRILFFFRLGKLFANGSKILFINKNKYAAFTKD